MGIRILIIIRLKTRKGIVKTRGKRGRKKIKRRISRISRIRGKIRIRKIQKMK